MHWSGVTAQGDLIKRDTVETLRVQHGQVAEHWGMETRSSSTHPEAGGLMAGRSQEVRSTVGAQLVRGSPYDESTSSRISPLIASGWRFSTSKSDTRFQQGSEVLSLDMLGSSGPEISMGASSTATKK